MEHYDVVVIGAGAIGTSVAYHLCLRGLSVALLDSGDVAGGSSSHCDAVVGVASGNQDSAFGKISFASVRYTAQLAKTFSYDFEANPKGCIYVFESDAERELGKEFVKKKHAEGLTDYKLLDNRELHDLEPYIAQDLCGGYYCSGKISMTVSPYKLCFAFVEEAKKTGLLTVFTYCHIWGIERNPQTNSVEAVDTDKGKFYAGSVVNCAGVWSNGVGKMVGVEIPVYPRKGTNLVSEKTKKICFHKIFEYGYIASVHPELNYKRQIDSSGERYNVAFNIEYTNSDNLLLGGNRTFCYNNKSELEVMRAIAKRGIRFYPELRNVKCIRSYAGFRPFTKDLKPIMSDVKGIPGFYICTGHEGSGILSCATSGKLMAQMITGEKMDFNIDELNIERFRQGRRGE